MVIFSGALAGCGPTQSSQPNQKELAAEILKNGRPAGIIGDINLIEIPLSDFPEINLIQIVDLKAKIVVAQGNATRLRDYSEKKIMF